MVRVVKRSAQAPHAGTQIVERGFVGRVPPQQSRHFAAMLTALRAERQGGEQYALALPERGQPLPVGKLLEFKAAEEAERPTRSPLSAVARSCSPTAHRALSLWPFWPGF